MDGSGLLISPRESLGSGTRGSQTSHISDMSGSSTASMVLQSSTAPDLPQWTQKQVSHKPSRSDGSSADSSLSSTGSMRVRIKAKYLRERKSPFETAGTSSNSPHLPPALPGNLPVGYKAEKEITDIQRNVNENVNPTLPGPSSTNQHEESPHDMQTVVGDVEKIQTQPQNMIRNEQDSRGGGRLTRTTADAEILKVPNPTSSFGIKKKASATLCQGAPTQGMQAQNASWAPAGDVRVTQFTRGRRQQIMKEQLLKRYENAKPVKRYFQPKLVTSHQMESAKKESKETPPDSSSVVTATAAAAAAVAATAPLLKTQSDLQSKLDHIMEKLAILEHTGQTGSGVGVGGGVGGYMPSLWGQPWGQQPQDVQQRMEELTKLQLEQLDKLHHRQLELQAAMVQHSMRNVEHKPATVSISGPEQNQTESTETQVSPQPVSQSGNSDGQKNFGPATQHSENLPANRRLDYGSGQRNVGRKKPDVIESSSVPKVHFNNQNNVEFPNQQNVQKHAKYTPAVTVHRLPQGVVSDHENPSSRYRDATGSRVDAQDITSHGTQTSPLDTPAPRKHAPKPHTKETGGQISHLGRGLLEEILSSHDEDSDARRRRTRGQQEGATMSSPNINSSAMRSHGNPHGLFSSPAVKQAQRVVQQLGDLNKDVKSKLQAEQLEAVRQVNQSSDIEEQLESHYRKVSTKLRFEAEDDMEKRRQAWLNPAPLDEYLRRAQQVIVSQPPLPLPATNLVMSPSQHNAPLLSPSCVEAQALLKKVQSNREYLEANLEAITRTKEDEQFYHIIENLYIDGDTAELARIKQAVDAQISAVDEEIKSELRHGKLRLGHPSGRHSPPTRLPPEKSNKAPSAQTQPRKQQSHQSHKSTKPSTGNVPGRLNKKTVQARIDTGLRKPKREEDIEDERKQDTKEQNKENLHKRTSTRYDTAGPSQRNPRLLQDEKYMSHIYGPTRLQPQRSTLRDAPYLHFANQTPTKVKRPNAHHAAKAPAPDQKVARTQTELARKQLSRPPSNAPMHQYYFNPYPAVSQAATALSVPIQHQPHGQLPAPTDGQLIPMAIPLAEPRVGVGLAQPITISTGGKDAGTMKSTKPRSRTEDQEKSNVSVVNIVSEQKPELTVQQLPNVDIDTAPPTPASSDHSITGKRPPQIQDVNVPGYADDGESRDYPTHQAEPEEEPSEPEREPGISMHGVSDKEQTYHGPPFPPQPPPQDTTRVPSSDQLAADIRRRDLLENRAAEWVEQELMARMISEMYSRQASIPPERTRYEERPVSPSTSEGSDAVVQALGGGGLQLFVDAGQPVNPGLVSALVQEVLEEKIALCVGQHERELSSATLPSSPQAIGQPSSQQAVQRSPLPTPEATPPASPVPMASRDPSPTPRDRIPTPEVSEAGEAEIPSGGVESETESLKDLMLDPETSREDGEAVAPPGPGVTTPVTTPPPISAESPPQFPTDEAETPQPSPRASPVPLVVPSEPMVTPTPTPEPRSPVVSEPEEDHFEATLPPPSPEPHLPSPTPPPPPPPPKPATPAPPSVESSSSSETTPMDSTITQSTGREISEGEWLVSKSEEGRVPDETLFDLPDVDAFDDSSQSTSESTIKGAGDPDKDKEEPRSEGEVPPSQMKLTRDPVVALLSRLTQGVPAGFHPPGLPASSPASSTPSRSSSLGEVSQGQRPSLSPPEERLLYRGAYQSKPPKLPHGGYDDRRRSYGEVRDDDDDDDEVEADIVRKRDEVVAAGEQDLRDAPRITNVAPAKKDSPTPSPRVLKPQAPTAPSPVPRVIQVGGRPPPTEAEKDNDGHGGEMEDGVTAGAPRDRPLPPSLFSTLASDPGTRTMTPDAMNMDAFLQSGYLSQSFSQSEGGGGATSDFERSRPLGQTNNSLMGLNASGAIPRGSSHLGTSGMFSEDSLEVGTKGRGERTTQRSFQVTLPSIASPEDRENEESLSEGELQEGETISDVSEMTL